MMCNLKSRISPYFARTGRWVMVSTERVNSPIEKKKIYIFENKKSPLNKVCVQ